MSQINWSNQINSNLLSETKGRDLRKSNITFVGRWMKKIAGLLYKQKIYQMIKRMLHQWRPWERIGRCIIFNLPMKVVYTKCNLMKPGIYITMFHSQKKKKCWIILRDWHRIIICMISITTVLCWWNFLFHMYLNIYILFLNIFGEILFVSFEKWMDKFCFWRSLWRR